MFVGPLDYFIFTLGAFTYPNWKLKSLVFNYLLHQEIAFQNLAFIWEYIFHNIIIIK